MRQKIAGFFSNRSTWPTNQSYRSDPSFVPPKFTYTPPQGPITPFLGTHINSRPKITYTPMSLHLNTGHMLNVDKFWLDDIKQLNVEDNTCESSEPSASAPNGSSVISEPSKIFDDKFAAKEAARLHLGEKTVTQQFIQMVGAFVGQEAARIDLGMETKIQDFFNCIMKFIGHDLRRLFSGQDTVLGSAILNDFRRLAQMPTNDIARFLGGDLGSAFSFYAIGRGTRAIDKSVTTIAKTNTFRSPLTFQFEAYARGNSVSNEVKIRKLAQNIEQSTLHQFNRNVDLKIRSPSAVAIQRGWGELSPRQTSLLEQLSKSGKILTIKKNDINVYDLACLTAKTGDEFAMFTLGSRRVILRGNAVTTPIPAPLMEKFQAEKWTWSAHTHPANINATNLTPSGLTGDVGILLELDQEQSMIINSLGKRRVFDLNAVDYAAYVDPTPKPRGNQ